MPSDMSSSYGLGELVEQYPQAAAEMIPHLLIREAISLILIISGVIFWFSDAPRMFLEGWLQFLLGVGFIAITLIISLPGFKELWELRRASRRNPRPQSNRYTWLIVYLVLMLPPAILIFTDTGIGLTIMGLFMLYAGFRTFMYLKRIKPVQIFERGITVLFEGEFVPIHWEQISSVWVKEAGGQIDRYDDPPVTIRSWWFSSWAALSYVQEQVGERLHQELLAQYNAGKTLSFGKFKLNQQGITCVQTAIPWKELDQVFVSNGQICIRQGTLISTFTQITAKDIPNLNLLVSLSNHILSPPGAAPAAPEETPQVKLVEPVEDVKEYQPLASNLVSYGITLAIGLAVAAVEIFIPGRLSSGFPLTVFWFGAAFILMALGKFIAWFLIIGVRVRVSEAALTYIRSGKTLVFRWEDVRSVQTFFIHARQIMLVHGYMLKDKEGRVIHLPQGLGNIAYLGETVHQKVRQTLTPQAAKRIEAGGLVRFSRWGISKQGIRIRNRLLPWDEVGEITFTARAVLVTRKGDRRPWARIPIIGTPNLGVFLALVDRYSACELPAYRVS